VISKNFSNFSRTDNPIFIKPLIGIFIYLPIIFLKKFLVKKPKNFWNFLVKKHFIYPNSLPIHQTFKKSFFTFLFTRKHQLFPQT